MTSGLRTETAGDDDQIALLSPSAVPARLHFRAKPLVHGQPPVVQNHEYAAPVIN
jgi:hypothetical protein